jgi:hypothetical protein
MQSLSILGDLLRFFFPSIQTCYLLPDSSAEAPGDYFLPGYQDLEPKIKASLIKHHLLAKQPEPPQNVRRIFYVIGGLNDTLSN